ncbi:MAG TPA: hypothetical protein VK465_08740 [Fibrobacteria bacterium]|nr:hypothetical protein [Fibrobacteria bacterium]
MSEETTKRPKPGSYPTFTSLLKASTVNYQKPAYGKDPETSVRKLVSERVTITLQSGIEFDAFKECEINATFRKHVVDGYLKDGKRVHLDPAHLQKFLEDQVKADTNKVIRWKDRPRNAKEVELENIIAGKDSEIARAAEEKRKLQDLLRKNKIPFEAEV